MNGTDDFFMNKGGLWIAIALGSVAIAAIVTLTIIALVRRSKARKRGFVRHIVPSEYYEALGGVDNILKHSRTGSRISLYLKDDSLLDKEKLKEAGVDGFIKMSDHLVLVIKGDAAAVEEALFGFKEVDA